MYKLTEQREVGGKERSLGTYGEQEDRVRWSDWDIWRESATIHGYCVRMYHNGQLISTYNQLEKVKPTIGIR